MNDLVGKKIRDYEIRERIGSGGYGVVYRAFQPAIDREVAIKVILPARAKNDYFVERFDAEAHMVAKLEHPYIVPLYDYWQDKAQACLVMRWLPGGNLRIVLNDGPAGIDQVVRLLNQIGDALSKAHSEDIIHRDIKPDNILLDEDGNHYLTDFGIAKDFRSSDSTTTLGGITGTPAYLSPEQGMGKPVTSKSDIYSFGVLLFELLTGKHPFPEEDATALILHHVMDPLPSVIDFQSDLPSRIDDVLAKATAKSPEQRYESVHVLITEFKAAVNQGKLLAASRREDALRVLLNQWMDEGIDVLDTASLGIIEGSLKGQSLEDKHLDLIAWSALNTRVDFNLLLRKIDSEEQVVRTLVNCLSRHPKPIVRKEIVSALVDYPGQKSTALLQQILRNDESGEVRSLSAIELCERLGKESVVEQLLESINQDDDQAAMTALVSVAQEFGLPEIRERFPRVKFTVEMAKSRFMHGYKLVLQQAKRTATGVGLLLIIQGLFSPFNTYLLFRDDYYDTLAQMSVLVWAIGGAVGFAIIGVIQGWSVGLLVGLADVFWPEKHNRLSRVLMGSFSGILHASTLILFTNNAIEAQTPSTSIATYSMIYLLYGLFFGAGLSFIIPSIGSQPNLRSQFRRSISLGILLGILGVLATYFVFQDTYLNESPVRFLMALLITVGTGLALSTRNRKQI